MRMVPASTSRRNPATMSGTSTRTATGIATTRSHWGVIDTSQLKSAAARLRADVRHCTAVAAAIYLLNPQPVAGPNADTGGAIFRTQCGENLYHLTVHFDGYQPLAIGIKTGGRTHLVLQRALQRERWCRGEAHEEIPDRPDEQLFEQHRAQD